MVNFCHYGCGKEATHQFKNGKWCCSNHINKCSENNRKITKSREGYRHSEKTRKKISESNKGRISPMYGKKHTEEAKRKMSNNQIGEKNSLYGKEYSIEEREKRSEIIKKFMYSKEGIIYRKKLKNKMLNGRAAWMNKFIKNPSKPEILLREIVKELYPNCEFQYQVFNYSLDTAIPEYKIAIEYDGWYHFDCQEHIDYHKKRQRKIEEQGWKFIRYNIFSKFPTKNEIENEINKILKD